MRTIAIVLAAYNGEKYIGQQIESILAQSETNWELFVFDDASADHTPQIVEAFQKADSRIHYICNKQNLGVTMNFLSGLDYVYRLNRFDYFMFSDQDDIWMPEKIKEALCCITEQEAEGKAVLVYTDLTLVDASGERVIAQSFNRHAHLKHIENHVFEHLMAQPFVFGCTVIMNKELVRQVFPIPARVYAHDSWVSLIAAANGKVVYISRPGIRFRRHTSNTSGTAAANSLRNRIKRVTTGWKQQIDITEKRLAQCEAMIGHIKDSTEKAEVLQNYCNACRRSGFKAIRLSMKYHILRQGIPANMQYFITLLFLERKNDVRKQAIKN